MSSQFFSQNWEPHYCGSFLIFGFSFAGQTGSGSTIYCTFQAIDVATGDANSSVGDAIFKFRRPPGNGRTHISARRSRPR
jgi:hypothetical protein